ncbi:MAG: tectonin domain-containing protein [Acidobacteriota bacterium]
MRKFSFVVVAFIVASCCVTAFAQIPQWTKLSGGATDVGAGADGSVWIIGADAVPGGYSIYRWTGSSWEKVPGGATRIAVSPNGTPWVINNTNNIFQWTGSTWQTMPGAA